MAFLVALKVDPPPLRIAFLLTRAARAHGVPLDLLYSLAQEESGYTGDDRESGSETVPVPNFKTIAKNLDISEIMLKCIVKRSASLEFKGMKVMKAKLQ